MNIDYASLGIDPDDIEYLDVIEKDKSSFRK